MKTYKNIYPKLCSYKNLELAFRKASKGKNSKFYVIEFRKNLKQNILDLKKELEWETYRPSPLTKFTIRDPKTRLIRKSKFKDRIIHHAIVNILDPIYEPRFISDNFANRINKGTIAAIHRFDLFKRKASKNGELTKNSLNNNMVKGYVFKADMKKFFDSVDQHKLIEILRRKIKDEKVIWLITKILKNFDNKVKGMPLGNMTSQFFANVYLNDLDQFIKNRLKAKYYLRYVDDFVVLHQDKNILKEYRNKIEKYLKNLRIELHLDKSKIFPLYKGVDFLGFKIFYYYKRVRKRNVNHFRKRLEKLSKAYKKGDVSKEKILKSAQGWFAYIMWGNTHKLRQKLEREIQKIFKNEFTPPPIYFQVSIKTTCNSRKPNQSVYIYIHFIWGHLLAKY